jgi:hypothetical protein
MIDSWAIYGVIIWSIESNKITTMNADGSFIAGPAAAPVTPEPQGPPAVQSPAAA